MAMRKGFDHSQIITVLTNEGENQDSSTLSLKDTGFSDGEAVMEVLTCEEQRAQDDGAINVALSNGVPRVYYPSEALKGSRICQPGSSGSGNSSESGSRAASAATSSKAVGVGSAFAFVGALSLFSVWGI